MKLKEKVPIEKEELKRKLKCLHISKSFTFDGVNVQFGVK